MKARLLSLILATTLLGSCNLPWSGQPQVVILLPTKPDLPLCERKPLVRGKKVEFEGIGEAVVTPWDDAVKLHLWIADFIRCSATREVMLEGYVEKLENRIIAVGGK